MKPGSSRRSLLAIADLVDEYRLFTYPVVQGAGRRLSPDGYQLPALRLLESRAFHGGITYTRYRVAPSGAVPGGLGGADV